MIEYFRHEPLVADEKRRAPLQIFFYDVPGLTTCGIFPPIDVLNEILLKGRLDHHNASATSWNPFSLSKEDYQEMLPKVLSVSLDFLASRARCSRQAWVLAPEFDHLCDWASWNKAIKSKYSFKGGSSELGSEFNLIVSVGDLNQAQWTDLAAVPLQTVKPKNTDFTSPSQIREVLKTTISIGPSTDIEIAALLDLNSESYSIQVMYESNTVLQANGKYAPLGELYGPDMLLRLPSGHQISLRIFSP